LEMVNVLLALAFVFFNIRIIRSLSSFRCKRLVAAALFAGVVLFAIGDRESLTWLIWIALVIVVLAWGAAFLDYLRQGLSQDE